MVFKIGEVVVNVGDNNGLCNGVVEMGRSQG